VSGENSLFNRPRAYDSRWQSTDLHPPSQLRDDLGTLHLKSHGLRCTAGNQFSTNLPARVTTHFLEEKRVLGLAEEHSHLGQGVCLPVNTNQFSGLLGQAKKAPKVLHRGPLSVLRAR